MSSAAAAPRVAAVIVTYNRRELLLRALTAIAGQTRRPDTVTVVDNASTDGTAEAVGTRFAAVRVWRLPRNAGGAGGFAYGIAGALREGTELVWLLDDDAIAEPAALAELLRARARHPHPAPALIASRVLWSDGRPHPMNTPRTRPMARRTEWRAAAAAACLPIRSSSFVSVLVDAAACRDLGLPLADYFLWNDDFEFTARLLRRRVGLLCPASVVVHHTTHPASTDDDPGARFFYEVRNKVWALTRSYALSPTERILYAGAILRRWTRTIAHTADRATLLRLFGQGLVAGVRRGPRPTEEVLAEIDRSAAREGSARAQAPLDPTARVSDGFG